MKFWIHEGFDPRETFLERFEKQELAAAKPGSVVNHVT